MAKRRAQEQREIKETMPEPGMPETEVTEEDVEKMIDEELATDLEPETNEGQDTMTDEEWRGTESPEVPTDEPAETPISEPEANPPADETAIVPDAPAATESATAVDVTEPVKEDLPVGGKAEGWEKVEQQAFDPNFDLEGKTIKGEDGGEYEFRKVVTKRVAGADVEKVIPVRKPDEKTLYMNEDAQAINDWDDRKFIIDKIEGIYEEIEGRSCCLVPGMWDILNNFAMHYIKVDDLPDHTAFREAAIDYERKFFRKLKFGVEMDVDVKMLIALWFEACLWQCKNRRKELRQELTAGQIDQRQFGNALQLVDMAENAIRKYQKGQIKL